MLTQGLSVRDLFLVDDGHVQRKLHALDDPVRAVVAPLHDLHAERMLSSALQARPAGARPASLACRAAIPAGAAAAPPGYPALLRALLNGLRCAA